MSARATRYVTPLLCAAGLCVPSFAAAASGSGSASPSSGGTAVGPSAGHAPTTAQPGNATVSASGDGITISTRASAILRRGLVVSGSVPAVDAGKSVEIQLWGAKTHWSWQPVAVTRAGARGGFSAVWETNHIGRFALRAVIGAAGAASTSTSVPTVTVIVYRPSIATLYGPGFYGQQTACRVTLRPNTIGLANRTLPCGTPVAIYYRGRTLIVPVIDRGPYAHGADWDLTMATGRQLGMYTTETIGATSLPRSR